MTNIVAAWREWSQWSSCSLSCATGSRSRSRDCENGEIGDVGCEGEHGQSEDCNEQECRKFEKQFPYKSHRENFRCCLLANIGVICFIKLRGMSGHNGLLVRFPARREIDLETELA